MAERVIVEEFEASFLQGYVDLKRRVATDHPDLDLSGYRYVECNYWVDEAIEEALVTTPSAAVREEVCGTDNTPAEDLAT